MNNDHQKQQNGSAKTASLPFCKMEAEDTRDFRHFRFFTKQHFRKRKRKTLATSVNGSEALSLRERVREEGEVNTPLFSYIFSPQTPGIKTGAAR
jgi:hypothetical protein